MNKRKPIRLQRYRQKHKRIDFYPSPDVLDILEFHQTNGIEKCLAGIIDGLIRAGHRSVSGNAGKQHGA
jgi:hypothetical protein